MKGFCSPRATKYGTTSTCSVSCSSIDGWRKEGVTIDDIKRWRPGSCLDREGRLRVHDSAQSFRVLHLGSLVDLAQIHRDLVGSFLHVRLYIRFHHKRWPWVGGVQRKSARLQWSEGWRQQQLCIPRWLSIRRTRSSTKY